MEPPKKKSKFIYIIYLLIIVFSLLYYAGQTGYYENKLSNETRLTKEAIMEFEKDIADGKAVDIKDYLEPPKDYQNKYSSLGYTVSDTISKVINEGVNFIVKIMETLFS